MKKLVSICLLASLMLMGCGSGEAKEPTNEIVDLKGKTLKVATVAPYPGYETMNEKGELEGLDIDLGNALAEKMGFTLEWSNLEFDAALLAVQSGQVDMAIAGLSPEPDRQKVMDFSEVYYQDEENTANTVVTLKSNGYKSIDDLKGLKVGVQNATIQQSAVEKIKDDYDFKVDTRKEYADIVQEILNGNIDFLVCEKAISKDFIALHDTLEAFPLGAGNDSNGNAIAFKKGSDMKPAFDKYIKEMKDNGEMQKIVDKWFGEGAE